MAAGSRRANDRALATLAERYPLVVLSVGALLLSMGNLAMLYLLQAGAGGADDEDAAIAGYDLDKPLEQELQLQWSSSEEDGDELDEDARRAQDADVKRLSRRARRRRRRREQLVGPHIHSFPQQDRGKMMVQIGLMRKAQGWEAANKCDVCWMDKRHCICAKLSPISLPVDFIVLMHYKEYLRVSNTGHLLPLTHKRDPMTDTGSELLIRGVAESDGRLAELEARNRAEPGSVIVLMPSDDAITLPELLRRRQEVGTTGRLKVVLLDGTWRQGRSLNRCLSSDIPRVKLQVDDRPSQFRLRRRTRPDGICTLEAAGMLVEELTERCGEGEDESQALRGMMEQLQLLNESVLKATNKPAKMDPRLSNGMQYAESGRTPSPAPSGDDAEFQDAKSSVGEGGGDVEEEDEEEEGDDLVVFGRPKPAKRVAGV